MKATAWLTIGIVGLLAQPALAEGMRTLRQNAWRKVLDGRTSVEEVLRVTKGDRV